MSGFWSITNRPSAGTAASASQSSPAGSASGGQQVRLGGIQASLAGISGSGSDLLVVRDGPTGTGTIIFQIDVAVGSNGVAIVQLPQMDLRATPGNALTVEFVSGSAGNREDINAQGDFVTLGWPFGQS